MEPLADGNWDDSMEEEEGLGFWTEPEGQIGGVVDMEDDVYLEFEEEAKVQKPPKDPNTWKLLARYKANFKPNAKSMFTQLSEEAWRLCTGIRYSERGKNYYMITLFSQGDYDFVMRGGPWIYKRNALLLKDFDETVSPSEHVIDSVPVWVRIYNVPGEKQNKLWGMRYGNGLGRAMEVDVPSDDQDMNEFLRVRVALPYAKRLQTQLTTGVKGKLGAVKVYKLKYERVPYFCSHCGFMGHKKEECEKRRIGVSSLEYEAYQLRCSPYKKFEYRAHFVPPQGQASARRGLSFASFGSAESQKSARPSQSRGHSYNPQHQSRQEHVGSQSDSDDVPGEMPPLEDIVPGDGLHPVAAGDDFEENEKAVDGKVEQCLLAQIDAMQVEPKARSTTPASSARRSQQEPIIQFPKEDGGQSMAAGLEQSKLVVQPDILDQMRRAGSGIACKSSPSEPHASDMIPAMRGLSNLQVSFGSAKDVDMIPVDRALGKRAAGEEEEVQGQCLDLSLGLNYGGGTQGGLQKKGRKQKKHQAPGIWTDAEPPEGKQNFKATGHVSAAKKARSHVWLRPEK
jgi:hypothetical protein